MTDSALMADSRKSRIISLARWYGNNLNSDFFGVFNMQQVFSVLQEYYCTLEELVDVLFQSTRTQGGRNKKRYTPRKINMEPENASQEKENHLPNHHVQVLCSSSGVHINVVPSSVVCAS